MPDESKEVKRTHLSFIEGEKAEISLDYLINILLKKHSSQYVCHMGFDVENGTS
jgi:hypothetical protein